MEHRRNTKEKVKYGDGIKTPERKEEATESIQPKLVYVTMTIEGKSPLVMAGVLIPSPYFTFSLLYFFNVPFFSTIFFMQSYL